MPSPLKQGIFLYLSELNFIFLIYLHTAFLQLTRDDSFQPFMRGWKSLSDRRALLILRNRNRRNLYFHLNAVIRRNMWMVLNVILNFPLKTVSLQVSACYTSLRNILLYLNLRQRKNSHFSIESRWTQHGECNSSISVLRKCPAFKHSYVSRVSQKDWKGKQHSVSELKPVNRNRWPWITPNCNCLLGVKRKLIYWS